MSDISKITLPGGDEYDLKDAYAREVLEDFFPVLADGIEIPKNSDLNSYVTPGSYYVLSTNASTITNSFITDAGFKLLILSLRDGSKAQWQIQFSASYSNFIIAVRVRRSTNGNWQSWKQVNLT